MKTLKLLRVCLGENMNLFTFKQKKQNPFARFGLSIFLGAMILIAIWGSAEAIMKPLEESGNTGAFLPIFVGATFIVTLFEGLYKTSSLLFGCKDDDLLFSLPVKRSTILFIRIFKFYLFETIYNALFLIPAIIVYACHTPVDASYWLVSVVMILLLPIIPVALSSVIGFLVAGITVGSRFKNISQIIITSLLCLGCLLFSLNYNTAMGGIGRHAGEIGDAISQIYYPAEVYKSLAENFEVSKFLIFILVNIGIFAVMIFLLNKVYFKINSKAKKVASKKSKKTYYNFKTHKPMWALIKKELKTFINTPVLVVNSGFGLLLYLIACVGVAWKFDSILAMFNDPSNNVTFGAEDIIALVPVVALLLIFVISLLSSITSSMISLEGKTISTLRSLPVKTLTILQAKIWAAVIIMIPFLLIGDIILFVRFDFGLIEMILILLASILAPLVAETIGLIINLRHPKLNADNDAEVVKQSSSSFIAVMAGMGMSWLSAIGVFYLLNIMPGLPVMFIAFGFYVILYLCLVWYLSKAGVKKWNELEA